MHYWDTTAWHMGWMMIWWIGVPVLLALFTWTVLHGRRDSNRPAESAEQILRKRYAKGEIDREAYQRIRADLKD